MSMPEGRLADNPLVAVGDEDVVLGFEALGFKIYSIKDPQEFKVALDDILDKKPAVCLVQDDIYTASQDLINNYRSLPLPVFIPFSKGVKTDLLDNIVRDIRLRATGAF